MKDGRQNNCAVPRVYSGAKLLANVEQREPGYLSWVEIDTRITGLRVRRAPLTFLRLSRRGSRVAKGFKGVRGVLREPMP